MDKQKEKYKNEPQDEQAGPNPVDLYVGARLKFWRGVKGLTQHDLAQKTGITFQQVQKYEAGKNRISASRLYQFAQILETSVGSFFAQFDGNYETSPSNTAYGLSDSAQSEYDSTPQSEGLDSKESIEVLKTYYAIKDEKLRKDFLKMMKQMAKTFQDSQK